MAADWVVWIYYRGGARMEWTYVLAWDGCVRFTRYVGKFVARVFGAADFFVVEKTKSCARFPKNATGPFGCLFYEIFRRDPAGYDSASRNQVVRASFD